MKLTAAAAVLVGNALPTVESSTLQHALDIIKSQDHESRLSRRSLHAAMTASSKRRLAGNNLKNRWADVRKESVLRNLVASQPGPLVECDPHADVGVLSCGPGQYCLESHLVLGQWAGTSKILEAVAPKGGLCLLNTTDSRRLQEESVTTGLNTVETMFEICYGESSKFYDCKCDDVDVEDYTGSVCLDLSI